MRIADEVKKRTGLDLDDLAKNEAFQHEVAYSKTADSLMRLQDATMILQSCASTFSKEASEGEIPRCETCWNFLVRATRQSLAVMYLLEEENVPDAAIFNRAILERALMLEWLRKTGGFEYFRQFTIARQFRHKETWIRYHPSQGKGVITDDERRTALKYEANLKRVNWHRPNMERVAKQLGILKMYEGIYHYSSSYVHPMYGEGEPIFRAKIGKPLEGYLETKGIIFGHTVSSLALLCLSATRTMGNPTRLGLILLEAIRNEASGTPKPEFDDLLIRIKKVPAIDLIDPQKSVNSNREDGTEDPSSKNPK